MEGMLAYMPKDVFVKKVVVPKLKKLSGSVECKHCGHPGSSHVSGLEISGCMHRVQYMEGMIGGCRCPRYKPKPDDWKNLVRAVRRVK